MIEIRFSNGSGGGEIDFSGTPKELRNVRQSILNFIQNKAQQVCVIEAATINPSPYDICLSALSICKSSSSIKVSVFANSLQIDGEPKKLETFADLFNFEDDTSSNYHSHFEHHENNELINANSISLIISVRS